MERKILKKNLEKGKYRIMHNNELYKKLESITKGVD